MINWINTAGDIKVRTKDDLTEGAIRTLTQSYPGYRSFSTVRIGHYSTITVYAEDIHLPDLVIAKIYPDHILDDSQAQIAPRSTYWNQHRASRLQACGGVMSHLYTRHPLYQEVLADIKRELLHLLEN